MSDACTLCGGRAPGPNGYHVFQEDCIDYLEAERNKLRAAIAHERDRARRVVRVFWRVRSEAAGAVVLALADYDREVGT